jgi:hypothetical protein
MLAQACNELTIREALTTLFTTLCRLVYFHPTLVISLYLVSEQQPVT